MYRRIMAALLLALLMAGCTRKENEHTHIDPDRIQGENAFSLALGYTPSAKYIHDMAEAFVETDKTVIKATGNSVVEYINKQTGLTTALCKDPLCRHTETDGCAALLTGHERYCYDAMSGKLYIARASSFFESMTTKHTVFYEIDIDNMDTSLREIYRMPEGSMAEGVSVDGGILYFSQWYLTEDNEDRMGLWRLDPKTKQAEKVMEFPLTGVTFTVADGVVYYRDTSIAALYAYDLTTGETRVVYESKDRAKYYVLGDDVYCQTAREIVKITPDGAVTLYQSEHEPIENQTFCMDVAADGTVYFCGYSPVEIETENGTVINTASKLFVWQNGTVRQIASLEDSLSIRTIDIIGGVVFLDARVAFGNAVASNSRYFALVPEGTAVRIEEIER